MLILFAGATYEEILNDKKQQAEYIEGQLEIYNKQIDDNKKSLDELTNQIDSLQAEINDLSSFLKTYENESYMTPQQIADETSKVIYLSGEVDRIQESFKKKVINLYKHGKNYELELLFSSKSPNEYLRRNQYLQHFSQSRKKELRELKSKKFVLEEKKKMLNLSTSSRRFYVEARRSQKAQLDTKLKELNYSKENLTNRSGVYSEKIKRYESQIINISNFINNLLDNKNKYTGSKTGRLSYDSYDLNTSKGNLNSPINAGHLLNLFGPGVNASTNTILFNNGVDFSVARGSKVYAIADGIVTLTGDLPYYGKCILIKHENGFRTLYACLSEVNAEPGSIVKLDQVIGKSGETLDGQMLHFEIWHDITPLNPLEWLKQ